MNLPELSAIAATKFSTVRNKADCFAGELLNITEATSRIFQ